MNLRAIANSAIQIINPDITGTLKIHNGFTYSEDGRQIPSYETIENVLLQVQSLNTQDLMHLGDMAQQGQYITVYINGLLDAQIRSLGKGEDLLSFVPPRETNIATWKITMVAEGWGGAWTRVLVCRQ